ncbi:MAG: carbohydrate ABC transporter permease [Oscillospiraceae bacterium]|nr:carbohydrate ABC transporter permease [Oscillospiraceae bacterium]
MAVIKKSAGDHIFDFINAVFMCFMIVITLYPFIYVVMASLSVPKLFLAHTGLLLRPVGFSLESYEAVLRNPNIKIGYVNTVFIVVVGTLCNVIATAIGAYVLSRKGPFWKGPLMFIIVITMFVGGGLVPNYILIQNLGLYNSLWSLILPGLISTHNMIVMRTAFQGIPESLEESARIDGANDWTILFKVIIPLAIPTMAVISLFYAVSHWNSWFSAMIYLKDKTKYPLQLVLREIIVQSQVSDMTTMDSYMDRYAVSQTVKYATIMVATIPILCVYPFLQKYFVKGVMIGAIKG